MKFNLGRRHKYIILQEPVRFSEEFVSLEEQQRLQHTIVNIFPLVSPTEAFVTQLEEALIEEATRSKFPHFPRVFVPQVFNFALGGALSIIGGVVAWVLWYQRQGQNQQQSSPMTV